jgi:Carboxypeptidase regulatory-like domain
MRTTGPHSIGWSLLLAWCLVASARSVLAQVAAGEITGLVKDPGGSAVPGAAVTVTANSTNRKVVVISSAEGVFTAPSLAPGEYRVEVELSGFRPVRREGVRLTTGEKARLDFDLELGDVREQVTVTAGGDREPRHRR